LSGDPLGSSETLLNVALFVPAGMAWTWLLGRPWRVLGALVAGSLAVEILQAVLGVGTTDVSDVAANTVGAAIGVGVASLTRRVTRRQAGAARTGVDRCRHRCGRGGPRQRRAAARRSNRQRSIEDELRARFANTTKAEVDAMLADTTGTGAEELFSAISVRSDGVRTTSDATELRYPATFFSLDRCVYVTWTADGVAFRGASGDACGAVLS
jgi:hypothetical protein